MKRQKELNSNIIGPSKIYPTPIQLDPGYYEGAIVYGDDGLLRFSNGTEWVLFESQLVEDIWFGAVDLGTMD
jgi:hypothetical protein